MVANTGKLGTLALRIEQVALICGVSVNRVHNWIEKNGLKITLAPEGRKVLQEDLVDFLVHYNMPIPKSILPINAKKVLFVYPTNRGKAAGKEFFKVFSKQIATLLRCVTDIVAFGKGAEYKILNFVPDLILVEAMNAEKDAVNVIKFIHSVGGMRVIALTRRNLVEEKKEQMLAAGAHAVVARNTSLDELLGCMNSVLNSLGQTSRQ